MCQHQSFEFTNHICNAFSLKAACALNLRITTPLTRQTELATDRHACTEARFTFTAEPMCYGSMSYSAVKRLRRLLVPRCVCLHPTTRAPLFRNSCRPDAQQLHQVRRATFEELPCCTVCVLHPRQNAPKPESERSASAAAAKASVRGWRSSSFKLVELIEDSTYFLRSP